MFTKLSFNSVARKSAKALVGVAAMFSIATGTVACNSEDAALIGGAIAIVAGAVAIDAAIDSHHSHRPKCHGGYKTVCRSIRDRFGRLHTDCDREWDSCASRWSDDSILLAKDSPLLMSVPDAGVGKIALKYGLPLESAEKLSTVLQSAAAGNGDAFTTIGLSSEELSRIAGYELPSDTALDKIATSLALSQDMARGLVQQLMDETKAQMTDVKSAVWTACTSAGKWKTNANAGTCKSLDWNGCSPAGGASVCVAVR